MKRKVIILGLFLLGTILAVGQPIIEKKIKENIVNHKVDSRTQWDKSYMKGKLYAAEQKTAFTKYNKKGDVIELITYQAKDTMTLETYEYNPAGYRTEYTKRKGGGLIIAYRKVSTYDKNGNLLLEKGYNGTENFKNEYIYNSNKKLTEINYYFEDALDEKRVFAHKDKQAIVQVLNKGTNLVSILELEFQLGMKGIIHHFIYDI